MKIWNNSSTSSGLRPLPDTLRGYSLIGRPLVGLDPPKNSARATDRDFEMSNCIPTFIMQFHFYHSISISWERNFLPCMKNSNSTRDTPWGSTWHFSIIFYLFVQCSNTGGRNLNNIQKNVLVSEKTRIFLKAFEWWLNKQWVCLSFQEYSKRISE